MRGRTDIFSEADLEWKAQGTHGIRSKLLSKDAETGEITLYVDVPKNWKGGGVAHFHDFYEEVFIIEGDVTLNGRDYLGDHSYLYRPAGVVHGHDESAKKGNRAIIKAGGPLELKLVHEPEHDDEYPLFDPADGRGHVLHLEADKLPWTTKGHGKGRYGWKPLSVDSETGNYSAVVELPAGWSGEIALDAAHGWEWFVIDGAIDLADGSRFTETGYSYRPDGGATITGSAPGCYFLLWRNG